MKKRKKKLPQPVPESEVEIRDIPPEVPLIYLQEQLKMIQEQLRVMHDHVQLVTLTVRDQILVRPALLSKREAMRRAARLPAASRRRQVA
jgi:hypothetical protein